MVEVFEPGSRIDLIEKTCAFASQEGNSSDQYKKNIFRILQLQVTSYARRFMQSLEQPDTRILMKLQ